MSSSIKNFAKIGYNEIGLGGINAVFPFEAVMIPFLKERGENKKGVNNHEKKHKNFVLHIVRNCLRLFFACGRRGDVSAESKRLDAGI